MSEKISKGSEEATAEKKLLQARLLLVIIALGLLVSGLTCYWLPREVSALLDLVWRRSPDTIPFMAAEYELLVKVERGLANLERDFPEMFLGTDWLGFAHVVLAILFLGAIREPVRNVWIVQFGMICAVLVVPAAWLFGWMRGLPPIHYLVDASFGIGAMIPLYLCYRIIRRLEQPPDQT